MSADGSDSEAFSQRLETLRARLIELLEEVDELRLPFMVYLLSLAVAEANTQLGGRKRAV